MRQIWVVILLTGWLACGVPGTNADAIVVDGALSDWVAGVDLTTGYDLTGSLEPTLPGATSWIEDSVGAGGYVGPGYGGQNFDVEAAYSMWSNMTFYGAFVTGFDKDGQQGWGGSGLYRTGDLFFDLNYVPGESSWDLAIALSTHDDGGFVEGRVYMPTDPTDTEWYTKERPDLDYPDSRPGLLKNPENVEYVMGLFDVSYEYAEGHPKNELGQEEVSYASTDPDDYSPLDHNVYEVSLSGDYFLSLLSNDSTIRMHYTQECGNDVFNLDQDIIIPEPSLSLLALGAFIAGAFARFRKGKDDEEAA